MAGVWGQRFLIGLAALLAAALGLLAPAPAEANTRSGIGQPLQACIARDTGQSAAEMIRHRERFDCTRPQGKFGQGDYWVISNDINQRSRSRALLTTRIASLWYEGLTLHILYADGQLVSLHADKRGISRHIQLGAIIEHQLPRRPAEVVRVMWQLKGVANVRGILLGPRLATQAESDRWNLEMAAMYAGFGGLCLALLVYNLALWGVLRHRFQLYYCAMVAGLTLYAFTSSGALAWLVPDIVNNDRLRLNYLLLGFSAAMALVFARSFFEARIFAGWLGRVTLVVAGLVFGAGAAFALFAPIDVRAPDLLFTMSFLSLAAVVPPMLWRAWRLRSNYLWLFAIAWGAPILAALTRIANGLGLLPWSFWLDNSTILSMGAEALLSSLAIAYRIRVLSDERDAARAQEVIARRLADTDPLTGLLNRRAFLEQAIGRTGEQLLLIADLDHFKRVNETLGHDGGDEVLRLFARILRSSVPPGALVARIGGEEFAIVTAVDAPVESDAILAKLRATRMPFDMTVTASIGTCRGRLKSEPDWKQLYRGADMALFEAKSNGRDRARSAPARAA